MRQLTETWEKIERIASRDKRYKTQAYSFVMAAVEYTIGRLDQPRHVTAAELLDGIRRSAMKQYGPMAKQVFNFWGVNETGDFGNIVYNLIDAGLLSENEEDNLDDFASIYDFMKVFEKDYYGA